jgi:hypothetical protein
MARITIYVPDELAAEVRQRRGTSRRVNVSAIAARALRDYLRYGPEAEAEMRDLARELESDSEGQELLAENDAVAGDGLAEYDADPDDAAWLAALRGRFPFSGPGNAPGPERSGANPPALAGARRRAAAGKTRASGQQRDQRRGTPA